MKRTLAGLVVAAFVTLTSCAGGTPGDEELANGDAMGHVHGLGVDPDDGVLYVGAHLGLFRLEEGAPPRRVGDAWHDFMSFLVIGPRHFVASGHPDLNSDLPVHLGLIESTDAGKTWVQGSLPGKADFHAIGGTAEKLVAYNGLAEELLVTSDRKVWQVLDQRAVVDVAISADTSAVLTTTPSGEVLRYRDGGPSETLATAPPLAFLDWPSADLLGGVDATGAVHSSSDQGGTWRQVGQLPATPEALEVTPKAWYAAAEGQILQSTDSGATWSAIR